MRLDQLMSRDPVTVQPQEKVVEAARLMRTRHVSAALVVENDTLLGIITERDLSQKLVAEGLSPDGVFVSDLMTPNPVTASPETPVWDALSKMTVRGIRHLPVCEAGRPLGVVSLRDLAAVGADGGRIQTLLEGLDEPTRARVAEMLLWAIDRFGLRREDFSTLLPLEE